MFVNSHNNKKAFLFYFLLIKSPNNSDIARMDLRHYWGQSQEEPCNLKDLLVHRFFPYLFHWRYVATQSLTGVAVAFSRRLNRAEATLCATSPDAFLYIHAHVKTGVHSTARMPTCASVSQTCIQAPSVRASSCSLLSQHTAGVRWSWMVRLGDVQSLEELFYCL